MPRLTNKVRLVKKVLAGALVALSLAGLSAIVIATNVTTAQAASYTKVRSTTLYRRNINLWRTNGTRNYHAEINTGDPGDQVWIQYTSISSTLSTLRATIPAGRRIANTREYNLGNVRPIRACGKAGNRTRVQCTNWW
jgi:hypothetical protein